MMTLDEAIKHAEEVAVEHTKYNRYGGFESCDECAAEHRQLAEWLKELKQLRQQASWIPVSERLPEVHEEPYYADHEEILHESDHVLTCCKVRKKFVYAIGTVIHDEVCNSYEWSGLYDYAEYVIDDAQVLAWMPLPKPY